MADILDDIFEIIFLKEIFEFRTQLDWSLFLIIQLTIIE